jgi:hypothetical protein
LLGYDVPEVHEHMDIWSKTLGSQHRQLGHIFPFVLAMEMIYGDRGMKSALLHILLDLDIVDSKYIESLIKRKRSKK